MKKIKIVLTVIAFAVVHSFGLSQELSVTEGDAKIIGSLNIIKAVGDSTVLIGANAGINDGGAKNVFVGANAGRSNSSGKWNTFLGYNSGQSNTTGGDNTFVGDGAGMMNIGSSSNTFVGKNAGRDNLAGFNSFFGKGAGTRNTNGSSNTFVGESAGNFNLTGSKNTFIGKSAGNSNLAGKENTYVGQDAGNQSDGSNNTFIGYLSGRNNTGSDNVFIGNAAGQNNTGSNKLIINNNNSVPLIFGDFATDQLAIGNNIFATDHMLSVHGKVACEEVRVELKSDWPDYVFEEGYDLKSLEEVAAFIGDEGHLPGLPPASEVENSGLDIGEMNRILLEKIEELMLYTLQQQKEIYSLKVALLENKNSSSMSENK